MTQKQIGAQALKSPFAAYLDLANRRVLVVGGGQVASRKISKLLDAQADVTVVAPSAIEQVAKNPLIHWHQRPYVRGEVASYRLGVTATDDAGVNAQVARDGEAANVFVNSADDPSNCSFILPAVVQQGDLQVAISTNGRSPAMARWIRQRFESELTETYSKLLDLLSAVRHEANANNPGAEEGSWDGIIDDQLLDLVASGEIELAQSTLRSRLGLIPDEQESPV